MAFFLASTVRAQVIVNVSLHPPLWGPVGYSNVRYYYLPDVEAYYDVQSSMFIYNGGGGWIHRSHLPSQYSGYDLYGGYKVIMSDYRGNTPYVYFKAHKMKYAKGYHGNSQKTIGNKPGKGNSKSNSPSFGHSNNSMGQGHNKIGGHGNNNKNMEHSNGGGGGKGKKK